MMKEWLPIIISFIALCFSVYSAYIKDLRRKSLIRYRETWGVFETPTFSGKEPFDSIPNFFTGVSTIGTPAETTIYEIYTISLSNYGNRRSHEIQLNFSNLPDDLYFAGSLLTGKRTMLTWTPLTHNAPVIGNQRLVLEPIVEGATVTLQIWKIINFKHEEVLLNEIIHVEDIDNGNQKAIRVSGTEE